MRAVLVDTGPLVAFLSRRDKYHAWATSVLATVRPPLLTCEAVLSEAVFLVRGLPDGPDRVMELVTRGLVVPGFRVDQQAGPVRNLLARYRAAGMDFADACLVRMSELQSDSVLLTIDSEFRNIYRRKGRHTIETLMPPLASERRRR